MGPQKEKNLGALFTLLDPGLEMKGILRQNCCILKKTIAIGESLSLGSLVLDLNLRLQTKCPVTVKATNIQET